MFKGIWKEYKVLTGIYPAQQVMILTATGLDMMNTNETPLISKSSLKSIPDITSRT